MSAPPASPASAMPAPNGPPGNQNRDLRLPFIFPRIGTAVCLTVWAPFYRLQWNWMGEKEFLRTGQLTQPFGGLRECIRRQYSFEGGIRGLMRGNSMAVLGVFPQALTLTVATSLVGVTMGQIYGPRRNRPFWARNLPLAAGATVAMAVIQPLNYVRFRLAQDIVPDRVPPIREFKGIRDAFRKTYQQGGIRAFYRGFGPSLVGNGIFYSVSTLLLFRTVRPMFYSQSSPDIVPILIASTSMYVLAGVAYYPLEVVSRRMMMRATAPNRYRNAWECARSIMAEEGGAAALYRGLSFTLATSLMGGIFATAYVLYSFSQASKRRQQYEEMKRKEEKEVEDERARVTDILKQNPPEQHE